MNNYGGGLFVPNKNLSRTQLAQILYNHAGRPAITGASPFTDVADGVWYTNVILRWAVENGILNGDGDGRLNPAGRVTHA